jgi:hypothetical protein
MTKKKTLPETEIQIKIHAPPAEHQMTSKHNHFLGIEEDSVQDENRLDERSLNSRKFDRLHSLSIERESAFQTIVKTIEPENKV